MNKNKQNKAEEIFTASDFISDYLSEQMDTGKKCAQEEWLSKSEANKKLFATICSAETMNQKINNYKNSNAEEAFEVFLKTKKQHTRRRIIHRLMSGAAILAISLGVWGIISMKNDQPVITSNSNSQNLIKNDKPLLTLADGTQINVSEDSLRINNIQTTEQIDTTTQVSFNTLDIPPMCDFHFTLSDGTKVWMNAASTLKYPTKFAANSRTIYASGEIYLEVAKDAERPFYVVVDGMEIKVLGTAFNVRAYPNEQETTITLSAGKIAAQIKEEEYTLTPGKQLELEKKFGGVSVRKVDTNEALAWTKGYYVFKNARLADVASTLQNWYGVTIMMTSEISSTTSYTGVVNKEEKLEIFLQRLEEVSNVKCSRNGNFVTIY